MGDTGSLQVFGVAGAGHGVGTTHFTILLAAYLSDVRHRKTTVLEWNENGDFARIAEVRGKGKKRTGTPGMFFIGSEEFMPSAGRRELLQCRERGREAVVIDFGVCRESIEEEFLGCDRRFILGGVNDWQVGAFAAFAAKKRRVSADCLSAFGGETQRKLVERFLGIRIGRIPWSPEAGLLTGELLRFFGRLLPPG